MNRKPKTAKSQAARGRGDGRCSLAFLGLCLSWQLIGPVQARAQAGLPIDPICRLRTLASGEAITGKLEYDVKAALLYRCLELVQWPAETFPGPRASFRIGILGKNPFGESIESLSGKRIEGRKLVVKSVSRLRPSSRFQLVFVSSSESEKMAGVLTSLGAQPILTIGENPGFVEQGGMINLLLEGKNIRLEVNQAAAQKAGLVLDPRLKQLADALSAPMPASSTNSVAGPES